MTWRVHWEIGINSLWIQAPTLPQLQPAGYGLLLVAASIGSLLPDLNASASKTEHLQIAGIKPFFLPETTGFRVASEASGSRILSFYSLELRYHASGTPDFESVLVRPLPSSQPVASAHPRLKVKS